MFDERLKPPWQHSWVGGGLVDQSDAEVSEAKRRPEKAFAQLQGLRGFVRSFFLRLLFLQGIARGRLQTLKKRLSFGSTVKSSQVLGLRRQVTSSEVSLLCMSS